MDDIDLPRALELAGFAGEESRAVRGEFRGDAAESPRSEIDPAAVSKLSTMPGLGGMHQLTDAAREAIAWAERMKEKHKIS